MASSPRPCRPGTGGVSSSCVSTGPRPSPPWRSAPRSSPASRGSCRSSSGTRTARSTSSSTRARWTRSGRRCSRRCATPTRRAAARLRFDPAEYVKAFAAHRRAGQVDAALLDAMLLEELGAAEPEHLAMVEQSRSVGAMQALKPLDAAAWGALRAPGFDETVASLLTGVRDSAVAAHLELPSSRRGRALDPAARLDAESTVTAVRTLNWAARVLGVDCPDLYAGTDDAGEAIPTSRAIPPRSRSRPACSPACPPRRSRSSPGAP